MLILQYLNKEILEPLVIFMDNYGIETKEMLKKLKRVFKTAKDERKKVEREKDDYFGSAKELQHCSPERAARTCCMQA